MRPVLASWVAFASVLFVACSPPPPATLEFVDQSPLQPKLGEITTLRFRAVDSRGQPQAGTKVTFTLQPEAPGVEWSPKEGTTNPGDGTVSVQLVARGGRVASVVVVATADDKTAVSPAVSFAGAASSSRQFTFQCGSFSGTASGAHHAIGAWDETRHLIAGVKVNCIAHVADRNGDGVSGAQVSFLTEAGTIGPSSVSATDVVGNATVLYKSSLPLPVDVEPGTFTWSPTKDATHTGEYLAPLWMHPFLWTESPLKDYPVLPDPSVPRPEPRRNDPLRPGKVNNPRDNLVSLIAITSGEEQFFDDNNNGVYDANEAYEDTTEPFVDANDNGTWDATERFVDTDGNGRWDGKNGKFDTNTLIWVQERILWTGWPHPYDRADPISPIVRQISPPPPTLSVEVKHFHTVGATFLISDPWYNQLARNSAGDGCSGGVVGPVKVDPLPTGLAFTYPAYNVESYTISDIHDPAANPPPGPFADPGIDYTVNANCVYTAAQLEGHKVIVPAPTIAGRVK